jgi:hypothetical protein
MGIFDDRKRGFEEKFRLEEELFFRLTARRNRLFGKWAAAGLGLPANEVEEYVKSVVSADLQQPGDDDIITKVDGDLRARSIIMTRAQLREKLDEFAKEARAQMMKE